MSVDDFGITLRAGGIVISVDENQRPTNPGARRQGGYAFRAWHRMHEAAVEYARAIEGVAHIGPKDWIGEDGIDYVEPARAGQEMRRRPAAPAADFEAWLARELPCCVVEDRCLV